MENFFSPGPAKDIEYTNLRDMPVDRVGAYRDFVESLWARYRGNEDRNFLSNAKDQFSQRFWEMYLWVALKDMGFELKRESDEGPDFLLEIDGKNFWIEAVCPTRGDSPDAILDYAGDTEYWDGQVVPEILEFDEIPADKISMVYTNAIRKKLRKHQNDIKKGVAQNCDGYILAISGAQLLVSTKECRDLPYVIRACYGVGNMIVPIDAGL